MKSPAVIDTPILNSPFAEPARHWLLAENGTPASFLAEGRRRSKFVAPVPSPEHKTKARGSLALDDECGQRNAK